MHPRRLLATEDWKSALTLHFPYRSQQVPSARVVSRYEQPHPLGTGLRHQLTIRLTVFWHAALLPVPVMHTKTTVNSVPSPSPWDRHWKGSVLRGSCGRTGTATADEDHPQRKGTGEYNPCKLGKWGKRKSDDSLGIKDNSFLYCWELSVSLKVISEENTSCEPNLLLHASYQQILTLDRTSLQHRAPSACGGEDGDDSSTFCSKIPANTQAGLSDWEGSPPVT